MSNKTEDKIPKAYYYSVDGLVDEEGNLKKFTTASLGRDLEDEFDLESLGGSAALFFYLDNEEYKDPKKWPLTFKFYKTLKSSSVDLEMNLSFAPCFMGTPKKIATEKKEVVKEKHKRVRKPKEKITDEHDIQSSPEQSDNSTPTDPSVTEPT